MKLKKLLIALMAIIMVFSLAACSDEQEPAADIVVNNTKTMKITVGVICPTGDDLDAVDLVAKVNFTIVAEPLSQDALYKYFERAVNSTRDEEAAAQYRSLNFTIYAADWSSASVNFTDNATHAWQLRNASFAKLGATEKISQDGTFYICYQKITSPAAITAASLNASPKVLDIYINEVSTRTFTITIDAGDKLLFDGTVQLTSDNFAYGRVLKVPLDERGILYSLSSDESFINSIGDYQMTDTNWWSTGFKVGETTITNNSGADKIFVGEGSHMVITYAGF